MKITAYGTHDEDETTQTKTDRYLTDENTLKSNDMTIMSGKGLNGTGFGIKTNKKGKEMDKSYNSDDDESIDLQTIADVHQ